MKKTVVITGAASGIGQVIAKRVARDGHRVVAVDIKEPDETVEIIAASGGSAVPYLCDLRDSTSVEELFNSVQKTYGAVDVLINNAGTMGRWPLPITELTESDWDTVFNTNVKSVFLCCKHVLPDMRKQGSGVIVNMASSLALVAAEGCAVYCASKAAILHFTRALAVEEAKYGIRINVVCPGPVDTGMIMPTSGTVPDDVDVVAAIAATTALKRLGTPKEIAEVVWFAASEGASFMVGSVLLADGGGSIL